MNVEAKEKKVQLVFSANCEMLMECWAQSLFPVTARFTLSSLSFLYDFHQNKHLNVHDECNFIEKNWMDIIEKNPNI